MIKIIKEGKIESYKFKKTCPICECEFEYELCDLYKEYNYSQCLTSYPPQYRYTRYINCPCCGEKIVHDSGHDSRSNNNQEALIRRPDVIWSANRELSNKDCVTCPYRPDPNDPVFGDTPCTFCEKMIPRCK